MFDTICVHTIKLIKKNNRSGLWTKMHDIQDKLGVSNMSGLKIKALIILKLIQKNN